jgi:hypothetical protein
VDVALSRSRVVVAILVVLGWEAAAHAEDAPRPLVRETRGKTLEQM